MTLHLVIEYKWLHELGAHKIFFCPLCHCCYIPRAWIRIRVYVWRWVSACKYIYTYMYALVLTYISVHMGIIFLLHIMYYLWMIYICLMQLLFNFGNKLIFIVIVMSTRDAMAEWLMCRTRGCGLHVTLRPGVRIPIFAVSLWEGAAWLRWVTPVHLAVN